MMDQPRRRTPESERHLERVDDQLGAEMVGHRPADDPPREQVLDVREVHEPLPRRDVGDVRRPRLVRALGAKITLEQVRSDPDSAQPDRRAPALARQKPGDTGRSHQPLRALSSNTDVVLKPQLGVDPPGAIGTVRVGMDRLDLLDQPRVTQRPVRGRATPSVMEAGAVHAQRSAHHGDRKVRLLRRDQREDLAYGSPVSRAKKAAAFLRISRSIRSV